MAIPDYETLMLPLLKVAGDGQEHRVSDVVDLLARDFKLSEEERQQLLPSGKQTTFANRVHWAKTYLGQAGLLEATRRAHFRITDRGRKVPKVRRASTTSTFLNSQNSFSFANAAACPRSRYPHMQLKFPWRHCRHKLRMNFFAVR